MAVLNLIVGYWKKQTYKEKAFIIFVFTLFSYIVVLSTQKAYYKYQYYKQLEKDVVTLKDSIKVYDLRVKDLIKLGKAETIIIEREIKAVDTKLKNDEKTINNRIITDDDISKFLAKYE